MGEKNNTKTLAFWAATGLYKNHLLERLHNPTVGVPNDSFIQNLLVGGSWWFQPL